MVAVVGTSEVVSFAAVPRGAIVVGWVVGPDVVAVAVVAGLGVAVGWSLTATVDGLVDVVCWV